VREKKNRRNIGTQIVVSSPCARDIARVTVLGGDTEQQQKGASERGMEKRN